MTDRESLDRRVAPASVSAEIERMLEVRCGRVTPIVGGADANSRLARAQVLGDAPHPAVVYKVFGSTDAYQQEARNLAFVNRLGDFAPALLAHDDASQAVVIEFIEGENLYDLGASGSKDRLLTAVAGSLRTFAELHHLASARLDELAADCDGQPPRWVPPDAATLIAAWRHAISAAASAPEVPVPDSALHLLADGLVRFAEDRLTLVLFDVNPFNLLWADGRARIVDLGACRLGPAWLDLDLVRRVGLTEAEIMAAHQVYLDQRRSLRDPIADEKRFLDAVDYWEAVSALSAAKGFQEHAEGRWPLKPTLPPALLRHERFRDDVLADVWTICDRRGELNGLARIMEQVLPPGICRERHLRADGA